MVIHMNLTGKWFDKHLQDKNEEYRDLKPFWFKRLCTYKDEDIRLYEWDEVLEGLDVIDVLNLISDKVIEFKPIKTVIYSNGMKPIEILPRFKRTVVDIRIGKGKEEWGAEKGKPYFVIQHNFRIRDKVNC